MNKRSYLVIDDSLTARMKLKQLLEEGEAEVHLADNGDAGTLRALAVQPDVAILDVVLPDTDGISLCRRWQEHPELKSMPVILVSGQRSERDDRLAGIRSGAMGYLVKPFDDDEMIALVDTLFRLQQVAREQAQLNAELSRRNADLSAFAHVVSHDLKAPLRAIGSLVDCIVADHTDVLDADGKRLLELVKGRTQRMYELIAGILRYSGSGLDSEQLQDVESSDIVESVLETLAPPEHVQVYIDTPLPRVRYPRVQLHQVFQNLLTNAIQHLDKPEGCIRIRAEAQTQEIHFCVEDNGPGIPEHLASRIFEIFQTLQPRDERESTGVGLAIVRKIVEQNGGRVWVQSSPEQNGSSFRFSIPHKRDERERSAR